MILWAKNQPLVGDKWAHNSAGFWYTSTYRAAIAAKKCDKLAGEVKELFFSTFGIYYGWNHLIWQHFLSNFGVGAWLGEAFLNSWAFTTFKLLWKGSLLIRLWENNARILWAKNQLLVTTDVHILQEASGTLVPIELLSRLIKMK